MATGCHLNYEWKKNGQSVGGDSWQLTLDPVQASDDGALITVRVSNGCGPPIDRSATLTVGEISQTGDSGISGSHKDQLWWMGEEVDAANYSEVVTLTAEGADAVEASYSWQVVAGTDFVEFEDGSHLCNSAACSHAIDLHSLRGSDSQGDVSVRFTLDSTHACTFETEVREPRLFVDKDQSEVAPGMAFWWKTVVAYDVLDNFDDLLPANVAYNEDFRLSPHLDLTPVFAECCSQSNGPNCLACPGCTLTVCGCDTCSDWGRGEPGGHPNGDPTDMTDGITPPSDKHCPVIHGWDWEQQNGLHPDRARPVQYFRGRWYVGSSEVGKGVLVRSPHWQEAGQDDICTWRKHREYADHY